MEQEQQKFSYEQWMATARYYSHWLSGFLIQNRDNPAFMWRGFSIWYIVLPAKKDVEVANEWFNKINQRVHGKGRMENMATGSSIRFVLRFMLLFLYECYRMLLCKYGLAAGPKNTDADVYFHSLSPNINGSDPTYDRHFGKAPLRDADFSARAAYAILAVPGQKDISSFLSFRKKFRKNTDLLNRPYFLLNHYYTIATVIDLYFSVFRFWLRFRSSVRKDAFSGSFSINGIACDDILINEVEKSLLGDVQWALLYGNAFGSWIKKNGITAPIVTYGETLSPIRPVYFFSKKANPGIRFYSIQHSVNNRNKLGLYHSGADFQKGTGGGSSTDFHILPDYYLLQGSQFRDIAAEFYPPDRTGIIGCLKYDEMDLREEIIERKRQDAIMRLGNDDRKLILIAPSVNDAGSLIGLVSNPLFAQCRIMLCPHPATDREEIKTMVLQAQHDVFIEVAEHIRASDLFPVAYLVICGYSASCYEALMYKTPAIQFCNLQNMPLIEPVPEVPFFSEKQAFWDWFGFFSTSTTARMSLMASSDQTVRDFFYKIDGKAAHRLWQYITNK